MKKVTRVTKDAPAPTPLEVLAQDVEAEERRRSLNHRRFLRRLAEHDPEVVKRALDLWESKTAAAAWLAKPHPELGHRTPYRMIARGRRKAVLELLGRLYYGFFA